MENIEIKDLTDEERKQYEDKATEIAKAKSLYAVYPVVFVNPESNERVVCYLQEPNYMTKLVCMNKASEIGIMMAAEDIRVACTIKDESHALTHGDSPHCDAYKLGVCAYIISNMITTYQDRYKKK